MVPAIDADVLLVQYDFDIATKALPVRTNGSSIAALLTSGAAGCWLYGIGPICGL